MSLEVGGISINRLNKAFHLDGRELPVLEDINLSIAPGEIVAFVGSSGCGKTTLLRILLGLERDYTGAVLLDGTPITGPGVERGVVFQDHRLLPWLTLAENVDFALPGVRDARERESRTRAVLDLVGLRDFGRALPGQVSGRMAQRAAIARALVNRPRVLLLDEPLGALDALTRLRLQQELATLLARERVTTVLVTHDMEEAVLLADRVVVFSARPGRVKRQVEVRFPRPRRAASAEFQALKESLLGEFRLAPAHPA